MYRLFLATPEKVVFDDFIHSIIVPGTAGYFEILTNHAPVISTLKAGKLVVTDTHKKKIIWNISGGFLEMLQNQTTLLADSVE